MKKFFSPSPLWQGPGLTIIRIMLGIFMIYHGWEVFDAAKMKEYTTWDVFKHSSSASFMVYLGKGSELVAGILFLLGCFTRIAAIILICTMCYIAFGIGNGKIWYDDQYPFLFAVLALVFFFTGPGRWSVDYSLFNKNK